MSCRPGIVRMQRREFITLLGGAAIWPPTARAQQAEPVRRIGFLGNDPAIPAQTIGRAFLEGLREGGFIEGKTVVVERRFTEGRRERYHDLAEELVGLRLDVIVGSSEPAVLALQRATKTVPIVMLNVQDPIASGLVTSLASPGGNITGLTFEASTEITGKRLELLKKAAPRIRRVAVLMNPDIAADQAQWQELQRVALTLGVTVEVFALRGADELQKALEGIIHERLDALYAVSNGLILIARKSIINFAAANGLPAIYTFAELVADGGLMSYGANRRDLYRRAGLYAARILHGAKPTELPIEQPTKFELLINLTTAKALGITIPPTVLALADEVIE
jgi:putative tryptophan/tyrosine transport system substrate-binding protein